MAAAGEHLHYVPLHFRQPQADLKLIAELGAEGAADNDRCAGMIEVLRRITSFFQSLASGVEQHELQRIRLIDLLGRDLEFSPVILVVGNESAAAGGRKTCLGDPRPDAN